MADEKQDKKPKLGGHVARRVRHVAFEIETEKDSMWCQDKLTRSGNRGAPPWTEHEPNRVQE